MGSFCVDPADAAEVEEDCAKSSARKLDQFLTTFVTPLSRQSSTPPDLVLKERMMKSVRCLSADGARSERRHLFLACQILFKFVIWVLRDPAHILRVTAKEGLHADALFGEVWTELFSQRHALVPDIQNSGKWKALLEAMQRQVFAIPQHSQDMAMEVILKHLSFAKHRFDSVSEPEVRLNLRPCNVAVRVIWHHCPAQHCIRKRRCIPWRRCARHFEQRWSRLPVLSTPRRDTASFLWTRFMQGSWLHLQCHA